MPFSFRDPWGTQIVVSTAEGSTEAGPSGFDRQLTAEYLVRVIGGPRFRANVQQILADIQPGMIDYATDEELVALISHYIDAGWLHMETSGPMSSLGARTDGLREPAVSWVPVTSAEGGAASADARQADQGEEDAQDNADSNGDADNAQTTAEPEEKIRDWKAECAHHAEGKRALHEKGQGTTISLVPDKGQDSDKVTFHWRDDYRGSLPDTLTLSHRSRPIEGQKSGSSGGYDTYDFDAKFLGDLNAKNPFGSYFWRNLNQPTHYLLQGGPTALSVRVYNPRQLKFEFKMPPMGSIKAGHKYEVEGAGQVKDLAQGKRKLEHKWETEEAYWTPKKVSLETTKATSHPEPGKPASETETGRAPAEIIKFSVDGQAAELNIVKVLGTVLNFVKEWSDIVKMVKDYAPKVGWYIDFSLQLLQGTVTAEWYWKEHTDYRVYRYIDFEIGVTLFNILFELGIGAKGLSFSLQIYAQIGGEMSVTAGGTLDHPDGSPSVSLPKMKGKVLGALGARAEAGYFFKFEAKGETAVEAEAQIAINKANSILQIGMRTRWTGISCTFTASAGLFGISGTKTKKYEPIKPTAWADMSWPSEEEYKPPVLSKSRIAGIVEEVLYRGWDVRVFDGDTRISTKVVANMIADRIERDSAFDKRPGYVDALVNAIRQDLDKLGERSWARDYVELSDLRKYLSSAVNGLSIRPHLREGASPTAHIVQGG